MRKLPGILFILAAIGLLIFGVLRNEQQSDNLIVNVTPAVAAIISSVAGEYEKEFGGSIQVKETSRNTQGDLIISPQGKEGDAVREVIPFAENKEKRFQAAVLVDCQQPAAALRFARYLAAPDKGGRLMEKLGMIPVPGDAWAVKPDLILYSGGVNRPAIENLLAEFSEREGIDLTTVFNGCGILCAAMQTMTDSDNPRFPDAYFACDLCFVPPVAEHFSEVVLLTETDIGIAFPIENPHHIKTLTDLAKTGLKVGLCNQKQSTLGYMTGGILKSAGLEKSISKNVAVEVPTADFLISQMRSGALDAAIVYRVNAELQKASIQFIPIKHEGARAVQPFSVWSESPKRQLATRLKDHFVANPEAFEETGFIWRGDEGTIKSEDIEVPEWLKN